MISAAADWESLRRTVRWDVPARYNIGVDALDRWAAAEPDRPAILDWTSGTPQVSSFGELSRQSDLFAAALRQLGVRAGDRIAILLPQMAEVVVAHAAAYKLGAIALPLAAVFGADALAYRFLDSGARVLVTNAAGVAKWRSLAEPLPELELVISVDGADGEVRDFHRLIADAPGGFVPVDTCADDPALMIYTSGTTGQPKGALHAHRVLLGHAPGIRLQHEFMPQPGDLFWTPSDWAWAGGLLNALFSALRVGVPVVACRVEKFEPEWAFDLMARAGIRNVFMPPTALRMLRGVENPRARFDLQLRTLGSAGEALGAEVYNWGREALGLTINEFYGQTECNLVLGSCAALGVSRAGAIGKVVPGHDVAIIRPDGSVCAAGELGQIAVRRPNPVMFLGYWRQPEATAAKFVGDWMTTGDQGTMDEDGYVFFVGRDDDLITSSGYRIGPSEVEDCLLRHPAVANAAVVGKPDALRTEIVKAFVMPRPGYTPGDALADEIRAFVRRHLSAHEYPREIAFVTELPMTTTGKIIRRLLREKA